MTTTDKLCRYCDRPMSDHDVTPADALPGLTETSGLLVPSDGIADGGEPYTADEMRLMAESADGTERRDVAVKVVPDQWMACPECGAYWGNPTPGLDFPNRFKVDDWARCYNPRCATDYYQPI